MRKELLVAAGLIAGCFGSTALAQQADTVVLETRYWGESDTLYNLVLRQPAVDMANLPPATEMIQKHGPLINELETNLQTVQGAVSTSYTQTSASKALAAVAGANFEGPGVGMPGFVLTGAPPDTTLAVGPTRVVAWVNSEYAVMTKTGTVLLLATGNTPFIGSGAGLCETTNRGDPILQYDRAADRWVLSQFAFATSGSSIIAPYQQCIAISKTPDPAGAYFLYVVTFGSTSPDGFNDYGKLGIWPDGYYTSYNVFGGSPAGGNTGVALCASERVKMLVGDPTAKTLCAPTAFYAGGSSFLPADMDGTTAPTTTAQGDIFVRYSFGGVSLRLMKLLPSYTTSTVTLTDGLGGASGSFVNLPVGPTTVSCNGAAGACIPQLGTTQLLDTLADRLMYRLAYRNRAGVDSLVVNQSVDPDGVGARASVVRWYEVRSPFAAAPVLFQNANYDPGASTNRWMGSIAMDKLGNMMMGYSVSNAATNPSIRVTGRLRTDLKNQMQAEQTMFSGTGSQTPTLSRWGDYTTMQTDPVDDCTFWYIGQYLAANGTFNWHTRIGSFKFNGCV